MTKRFAGIAIVAAAAAAFVLPAAPASAAPCTTPMQCAQEAASQLLAVGCIEVGTLAYLCPPPSGG